MSKPIPAVATNYQDRSLYAMALKIILMIIRYSDSLASLHASAELEDFNVATLLCLYDDREAYCILIVKGESRCHLLSRKR